MSFLARLSLANRGLVALVAIVITGFGAFAVPSLKQQLLPSLEFPAAFIVASYPGAAPEIVEAQVTEPIENGIQGVAGLDSVTSVSREGMATVQVEFEFFDRLVVDEADGHGLDPACADLGSDRCERNVRRALASSSTAFDARACERRARPCLGAAGTAGAVSRWPFGTPGPVDNWQGAAAALG